MNTRKVNILILLSLMLGRSVLALQVGDVCPSFSLMGSDGHTYSLEDMRGRSAFVIAWYPKAFTGGCTKECQSFRDDGAAIRALDVLYFTASVDDAETNRRFSESLMLDFPILSDPDKQVAQSFGVVDADRPVARRWTFYVGIDGRILAIDQNILVASAGADVANRLKALGIPERKNVPNKLANCEVAAGWKLIFNGVDASGWITSLRKPIASPIENGSLVPHESGGYLIVHNQVYADFELETEVKMSSSDCNSGIFFRVSDLNDPVQNGFEAQVYGASGGHGYHDFGALYDLAPTSVADFKYSDWNKVKIRAFGPHIEVYVNGKQVSRVDVDQFTEAGKRPDGSSHKFGVVRDMQRSGYLGFQDHGHKVWYRSVKVRELQFNKPLDF